MRRCGARVGPIKTRARQKQTRDLSAPRCLFNSGGLTPCVWLTQPILNREVRRAVVPRFKGWIRRGVSRLVSPAAEIKSQSRSAIHGRPIVTPILWRPVVAPVHGRVHRHAPSPIVIPAASAAILGLGDRRDNGQCGDSDKQSGDAAHVASSEFHYSNACVGHIIAATQIRYKPPKKKSPPKRG